MKTKTKSEKHNQSMRKYFQKTQGKTRSGKRWTFEEDCLIILNPLNDRELSEIIQRSQHSITERRSTLRKNKKYVHEMGLKMAKNLTFVKL